MERLRAVALLIPNAVSHRQGIILICMYCRKIQTAADVWLEFERYIAECSGARFSHGMCPDCSERVLAEIG